MSGPWDKYAQQSTDAGPWTKYGAPPPAPPADNTPPDDRNDIQKSFDTETQTNPNDPLLKTGLKSVVGAIGGPFVHPAQTAQGIAKSVTPDPGLAGYGERLLGPAGPMLAHMIGGTASQAKSDYKEGGLPYAATKMVGGAFGNVALGAGVSAGLAGGGALARTIGDAAKGDPNAAALRGLQIGPRSDAQLSTIRSVQNARPYVKGATSQADMQARLPPAMNEVWDPYNQAVNAIGDRPVKGPDGMTTVRELEAERTRLSALNRGVKSGNPSDIQQAMQEGRTPAQLIERESRIKAALDPHLASTGIDPGAVRDTYGSLADVRSGVEGKTTLNEKPQPSGLGRMMNMRLAEPKTLIGEPLQGVRDLVAGRPLWSAKPTDLGIKEGFSSGGEKPNLGRVTTTGNPPPPAALLGAPPREMAAPIGNSRVQNPTPQNFYHDTDAMRTGRLLKAPPIQLGGAVEGPKGQPFRFDTTPMRKGNILPPPTEDIPLSSHADIFPEQRPGSARIRPKTIEGEATIGRRNAARNK